MEISMFKPVLENLSIGIAVVDDSNQILQCNKRFCTYFNLEADSSPLNLDQLHSNFVEKRLSVFQQKTKFITLDKKTLEIYNRVFSFLLKILYLLLPTMLLNRLLLVERSNSRTKTIPVLRFGVSLEQYQ